MKKPAGLLLVALFAGMFCVGQDVSVVPYPNEVHRQAGEFEFTGNAGIYYSLPLKSEGQYLQNILQTEHGIDAKMAEGDKPVSKSVQLLIDSSDNATKTDEGYILNVQSDFISIKAKTSAGIFHGIQTLRQLIQNKKVPALIIRDAPSFKWRAFMLDEGRYFKGGKVVKDILDEMALLKMNVFHWHLTDDQGWRIEIKKYPRLTQIGSSRKESEIGTWLSNKFDGKPHSGFYTQEQIKDIVRYASERHITIIPEIEMPGHASAAIAAYPWLGTENKQIDVPTRFGIQLNVYNVADRRVQQFLHDVLDEVMALFPSNIIHIGGDEVKYDHWKASSQVMDYIRANNLHSPADLQIQFTNGISNYLEQHGHRMIGWNEILGGHSQNNDSTDAAAKEKLSKSAIVEFWTGDPRIVAKAAMKGHDVINAYWLNTYLDYDYQFTPLEKSYNFQPVPSELPKELRPKIVGLGAQMWGEWIPSVSKMNYHIYPRIAALAEVGWTNEDRKEFRRFRNNLAIYFIPHWKSKGINILPEQLNAAQENITRYRAFDNDWRFTRDSITNAERPDFDDAKWRKLDLPHDWSIENIPQQVEGVTNGPFSKKSNGPMDGSATAHTIGGIGWYRKTFELDLADSGKLVSIYFEGVYMEADVWLNGHYLGTHKHGYTSFQFDLTKYCRPAGEKNILAVKVTNRGQNSRWYSGSGIYRHVKLVVTDRVHIAPWGTYVTTPGVSAKEATVRVETMLENSGDTKSAIRIRTRLFDENGNDVAESVSDTSLTSDAATRIVQVLRVKSPKLWSTESPHLYKAEIVIISGDAIKDAVNNSFGIRSVSVDAANGLVINGKNIELKGGCVHHDNGLLGAAAIDRAEERKVELLKANGFNAVRSSHYPPSEKFLEACDRLGLLVIDEAFDMWERPKNKDDYHLYFDEWWEKDLSSMVLRDRNHPSIIFWSIGNEINERADSSGLEIIKKLTAKVKSLDSTRAVTMAVCEFWDHPGRPWSATAPAFALLDVGGYNYQWWQYETDHQQYPERIMMGTESVPVHAYENWSLVEKHPYVIGDFVWTAMDYLGESGIGHVFCDSSKNSQLMPWPWFNAWCGDIDLAGNKKPQSFYRDVVWKRSKIELAVHAPLPTECEEKTSYWGWPDLRQSWSWRGNEGKRMEVLVYSSAPTVRLELNGKIIGEQKINDTAKLTARFQVPYASGELKAIAIEKGKETGSVTLRTAGKAASIRLKADRQHIGANRNDLSYITAELIDKNGNVVPGEDVSIRFSISGNGELAGSGNADPADMNSFRKPVVRTFRGRCLAIVRPAGDAGKITLHASADNLPGASITVVTE